MEHHERRSVSVAEMHYRQDGTIEEVPYWSKEGVKQVESLNPYRRVEAETMEWGEGLKTEKMTDGGIVVNNINDGDYIMIKGVDFGRGGKTFDVMAETLGGGTIELRIDSLNGRQLGTCDIQGSNSQWKEYKTKISKCVGVHDFYLVFRGNSSQDLFKLDYWQIKR